MHSRFTSLDLQTTADTDYVEPANRGALESLSHDDSLIARGAGVSYVAASFGERGHSVGMRHWDQILSFEPEQRRITVGAGISLGTLYNYLLPHRLYLPIQPGHPQISVGGCVACNVHGKNPERDGIFADLVESLRLFHPDHGELTLSRRENAAVFDLTCGGFGLTGIILNVTLRLTALPAATIEVRRVAVGNLVEAFETIVALKQQYDFLYTWNDLSTFGKNLGRGYVCCAKFSSNPRIDSIAADGEVFRGAPLPAYRRLPTRDKPSWLPKVLHRPIIPWITRSHFYWQKNRPLSRASLFDMLYPGMYGGNYYFDLYGPGGFFAHMVLVPEDRWREYIRKFDAILRVHREPIIALAIKAFHGPQRLLHFNGNGFSMHSHIPNSTGGRRLIEALEALSLEFGVIRTIYFDSRLSAASARTLYPEYDLFKERLHSFDPRRRFASGLSRRLDL